MLPVAPATESSASTSGTPAANMVDRVRAKRATAALCRMLPMIGIFSDAVDQLAELARLLNAVCRCHRPAAEAERIAHHHSRMKSEMPMTSSVKAGRSAPKLLNRALNCGMTNSRMTTVTRMATMMTAPGRTSPS
jgi:hypothetical protein